jgi:hypothetical protein
MKCGDFLTCIKNHPSMTIHDKRKTIFFCVFYGTQMILFSLFALYVILHAHELFQNGYWVVCMFDLQEKKSWTWRILWIWTLNSQWKHIFSIIIHEQLECLSQLIARIPFPLTKLDIWVDFLLLYVFIIQCDSWAVIILILTLTKLIRRPFAYFLCTGRLVYASFSTKKWWN